MLNMGYRFINHLISAEIVKEKAHLVQMSFFISLQGPVSEAIEVNCVSLIKSPTLYIADAGLLFYCYPYVL